MVVDLYIRAHCGCCVLRRVLHGFSSCSFMRLRVEIEGFSDSFLSLIQPFRMPLSLGLGLGLSSFSLLQSNCWKALGAWPVNGAHKLFIYFHLIAVTSIRPLSWCPKYESIVTNTFISVADSHHPFLAVSWNSSYDMEALFWLEANSSNDY